VSTDLAPVRRGLCVFMQHAPRCRAHTCARITSCIVMHRTIATYLVLTLLSALLLLWAAALLAWLAMLWFG
jgi:hypothetical protein